MSVSANKGLVLTMPARRSFSIIARHKSWVVVSALFCRTGRWHGRTTQALARAFTHYKAEYREKECVRMRMGGKMNGKRNTRERRDKDRRKEK
jgi:hypothetical protein